MWPMLPAGVCEPSHPAGHTSARRRTEQGQPQPQPQPQQRFAEQFATHMRQGTVRCLQLIVARAYRSRPACGGPPAGRRTRTAGRHYHSHMRVCAWWMSAYRRRRLVSARALSGARQDLPRVGASQVSAAGRNDQISARTTKVTPLGPGPLPLARLERLHHPLKRRGFPTFLCLRHDLFRGPARVLAPHHLVAGVLVLVEFRRVLLPEPIPDRVPFFP